MNIFHQSFSTGQIAKATGVSSAALQSWLKRNLIVGQKDDPIGGGGSPGVRRTYSFFNAMEIAVAKGLVDSGLNDLPAAFLAASHFAHAGNEARLPSMLFDPRGGGCFTLLCVAGGHSTTYALKAHDTAFYPIVRHQLNRPVGFVTLEIDPIFDRVTALLGHDPRDVMALAYPRSADEAE